MSLSLSLSLSLAELTLEISSIKVARKDGQPLPGENEPLHAYVTAHTLEAVKKGVEKIKEVISTGINIPEGQNDLR